jgi:hypothetical protein
MKHVLSLGAGVQSSVLALMTLLSSQIRKLNLLKYMIGCIGWNLSYLFLFIK